MRRWAGLPRSIYRARRERENMRIERHLRELEFNFDLSKHRLP